MAEDTLVWIKQVVKKGKKYLVYINEQTEGIAFTEDQIVNYRIIKGNSFKQSEFEQIIAALDIGKIYDKVLKYIDYKPRTANEVITYLSNYALTEDQINEILVKLKQIRFVDDERYTKTFIEEQIRHQVGPKMIRHQLLNKGIEIVLIDQYLIHYEDQDVVSNALAIANKTLKTVVGLPIVKQKETIYSRLNRMGYDYAIINKVLSTISYSEVNSELLIKEYLKLVAKEKDQNKIINKLMAKGYNYQEIKKVIAEIDA